MKKKISIIIPCYNAEKTLSQCLESISKQSIGMESLDIILINDASTDSTKNIINDWYNMYPDSITPLTLLERSLQGAARNIGIKMAVGNYIMFVDSDDWLIGYDILENIYNKSIEYNTDISKFLFSCEIKYNAIPENIINKKDELIIINTPEERYNFFKNNTMLRCCWDKIYKRKFVQKYDLQFAEGVFDEESLFTTPAYIYFKKMYINYDYLYNYYHNSEGTSKKLVNEYSHKFDNKNVWEKIYDKLLNDNQLKNNYRLIEWMFIVNYFEYSINLASERNMEYRSKEIDELINVINKRFPDWYNNDMLKNRTSLYLLKNMR